MTLRKLRKSKGKFQYLKEEVKRYVLLGMEFHRAKHLLTRKIIREFLMQKGNGKCLRCDKPIEPTDEYHVDHIDGWIYDDDPLNKYLDLSNIAISHSLCNIVDGLKKRNLVHKTRKES